MVKRPVDWHWNSYFDLLRLKEGHVVSFEEVLALFGTKPAGAVKSLQKHINGGLAEGHNESYYKLKGQRVLGENEFAQEVVKLGDAMSGDFEYYNVTIDDVVKMVAEQMGIGEDRIRSVMRERIGAKARGVVAYISKTMCGKTAKEVGQYFGRSEPVLSKLVRRVEFELTENKGATKELFRRIVATIKKNHRPCFVRATK